MKNYLLLMFVSLVALGGCNNNRGVKTHGSGEDTGMLLSNDSSPAPSEEIKLYNIIKNNYKDQNFLSLQFEAEKFYKQYRLSDKMDSVELMYERALDVLDSIEMEEEGSLAFKRYKLSENPILNPNPAMTAPAEDFLDRFVGRGSDFAKQVRSQLREPDSFEYIETKYMNKNSGYIALVMRFKAKNGIGLVVEREALGKFDKITETFSDVKIRD